jgi:hypothetical protein
MTREPRGACGRITETAISRLRAAGSIHGIQDREAYASYCKACKKWYCGLCAFPNWQRLKREHGLDGYRLAEKIGEASLRGELDSGPILSESPTCPVCRTELSAEKSGGCFIATAACGDEEAWEVRVLRDLRDHVLLHSRLGLGPVDAYTRPSPPVARWISHRARVRGAVRSAFIRPLARLVVRLGLAPRREA